MATTTLATVAIAATAATSTTTARADATHPDPARPAGAATRPSTATTAHRDLLANWQYGNLPVKKRPCLWCDQRTDRLCGICLDCCRRRDAYDKAIDEGKSRYIPPTERPNHRLFGHKELSEAKKAALDKATASKTARIQRPNAPHGV